MYSWILHGRNLDDISMFPYVPQTSVGKLFKRQFCVGNHVKCFAYVLSLINRLRRRLGQPLCIIEYDWITSRSSPRWCRDQHKKERNIHLPRLRAHRMKFNLWKGELLAFFMLRFWFSLNGSTMNGEIMDGKSHFSEPDNKGCDAAERENWSISWLGWMGDKSDELTAIEERKDFNGICREKMSMKNCLRMQKTRFHSLSQLPDAPSFLLLSFLRPR